MIQTSEKPHVYLWYIAETKQFYLGVNWALKPYYTHSAETSKEFRSIIPHSKKPLSERMDFFENPPKGISRHILKEGTAEEMCELEHELLKNRKKRCWNRYYNNSLGDPRYVDQSGENNPMWKGGVWANDPQGYEEKRRKTPEYKERNKLYGEKYRKTPEYKERRKLYDEKYLQTEKYQQTYGNTEYRKKYEKERYAKKKTETQGEGTLKAFLG
jgi:hypothetical protein